jgi:hypothetical protein
MGDSPAARNVESATADRASTARTHAGMHPQADTGADAGGDSVRDRPTDGSARMPSVRATVFTPAQNKKSKLFAAMGGTHSPLAVLRAPPQTVA